MNIKDISFPAFLDNSTFTMINEIGTCHNKTVLDVGCGGNVQTGFIFQDKGGEYTAFDINPKTLERHKEVNRWEIIEGDVTNFDFGDRKFDIVHARNLFMHLPEAIRPKTIQKLSGLAEKTVIIDLDWGGFEATNDLLKSFQSLMYSLAEITGSDLRFGSKLMSLIEMTLSSGHEVVEKVFNDGFDYYYEDIIIVVSIVEEMVKAPEAQEIINQLKALTPQINADISQEKLEPYSRPNLVAVSF